MYFIAYLSPKGKQSALGHFIQAQFPCSTCLNNSHRRNFFTLLLERIKG